MFRNWNKISLLSMFSFITAAVFIIYGERPNSDFMFGGMTELMYAIFFYIIAYVLSVIAIIQIFKSGQKGRFISTLILISPILLFFMIR